MASFGCITPRQRHSWPCSSAHVCAFSLLRVPEWTKCSSREKRKEKKVEKPFYSDSEGESGPTESADSESDSASGSESEESGEVSVSPS
ncbi:AP-3 complex subunit beta-2-like [Poeciliopsis prolifica]|uniref:AP-3 complex subunit beta-2-like n=1 Tax=Poeciliopsis prolifica TaxID=188132 RepID=UPI00241312F5|nr:AP-3 complex subunit beta-2-like [Poeciliopsis prolifica]